MLRRKATWAIAGGTVVLVEACVLSADPSGTDTNALAGLQQQVEALQQQVADLQGKALADEQRIDALEQQVTALNERTQDDPDCPAGYSRDPSEPAGSKAPVHCKSDTGPDEVVKVGKGGSAFWIDRYEASAWDKQDGTGAQHGIIGAGYPPSFPVNGQRTSTFVEVYAVSMAGVSPSTNITWFQAQQACRASGKRLPSGEEWLAAASGTPDPTTGNDGTVNGECVTLGVLRPTGGADVPSQTACKSAWGAEDMIGNVREWLDQWYAQVTTPDPAQDAGSWPPNYGNDYTVGFGQAACFNGANGGCSTTWRVPFPVHVGGGWSDDIGAGVFTTQLDSAPFGWADNIGFRCVIPR